MASASFSPQTFPFTPQEGESFLSPLCNISSRTHHALLLDLVLRACCNTKSNIRMRPQRRDYLFRLRYKGGLITMQASCAQYEGAEAWSRTASHYRALKPMSLLAGSA